MRKSQTPDDARVVAPAELICLRQGDRSHAVVELQRLLNAKGANLTVDGVFGPLTHRAVVTFQCQVGLKADGIVVPQTWEALRRISIASLNPKFVSRHSV